MAQRFDYPDVLRGPTREVLERFRAGGASLLVIWWVFALSAVLFAPLAVLLASQLGGADGTWSLSQSWLASSPRWFSSSA